MAFISPEDQLRRARQAGMSPDRSLGQRTYAGRYQASNPTLDALVRRREEQEAYRRRYGMAGNR
jgi:hypothetical protein